jgi:hypothetical protein
MESLHLDRTYLKRATAKDEVKICSKTQELKKHLITMRLFWDLNEEAFGDLGNEKPVLYNQYGADRAPIYFAYHLQSYLLHDEALAFCDYWKVHGRYLTSSSAPFITDHFSKFTEYLVDGRSGKKQYNRLTIHK